MSLIQNLFILIFIYSCQTSEVGIDPNEGLSNLFQQNISEARASFNSGKTQEAINSLSALNDEGLSLNEKAYKYNLVGSYFYSLKNYGAAEKSFEEAIALSGVRKDITAQVGLNLAISEEAQRKTTEAFEHIKAVSASKLLPVDKKRYFRLSAQVASQLGDYWFASGKLINYLNTLDEEESLGAVELDQLKYSFRLLDEDQRKKILDRNDLGVAESTLLIAMIEAMLSSGESNDVKKYLNRLESKYSGRDEIRIFSSKSRDRLKILSTIEPLRIGVLLPLSGSKGRFGQKVMRGIDLALGEVGRPYELIIRDDQNSAALGKAFVRELAREKGVAFFIGGLFPEVAESEFLTAKSHNSIFVSLSSMNMEVDQKNGLLFEMLGSVQSQIESIINSRQVQKLGNRVGIFYPETQKGKIYIDELWRQQALGRIKITALNSFEKKQKDFRSPIQKFLAVNLERERSEELEYWQQISELQKKGWIKRTQLLNPVLDFDWIFLPVNAKKALELIPVFQYYEARRMKFIGGPSWKSSQLLKNYLPLSSMFFAGDLESPKVLEFKKAYYRKFNNNAGLLQSLGHESMHLISKLNIGESERSELLNRLEQVSLIQGNNSNWVKKDGLWIKKMQLLGFRNGQIAPIY